MISHGCEFDEQYILGRNLVLSDSSSYLSTLRFRVAYVSTIRVDDGGIGFLWNVNMYMADYKAPHTRRQTPSELFECLSICQSS